MKQLFSLTALGLGLVLALGTAQAQTVASAPSNAFITAPTPGLTPEPAAAPSAAAAPALPPAAAAAVAAEPAAPAAPAPPVTNAPAPRSSYRASRSRGKVAQARPIKVCSVQVNAKKGEDRTASLSACLKE